LIEYAQLHGAIHDASRMRPPAQAGCADFMQQATTQPPATASMILCNLSRAAPPADTERPAVTVPPQAGRTLDFLSDTQHNHRQCTLQMGQTHLDHEICGVTRLVSQHLNSDGVTRGHDRRGLGAAIPAVV
jgi:hypothetical protein